MVAGIGVDCVKVSRMEKSLTRPSFVGKVFCREEQDFLESLAGNKRVESAAACFAAKEAFLKAVGVGLGGFALGDIAALRNPAGAPYYVFSGTAAQYVADQGLTAHLSLTHEDGLAMAFAILEKR